MCRWIHRLLNRCWNEGCVPDEWGNAIVCSIHKKGDHTVWELSRDNWRVVETKLGEWQYGFRPGRRTIDLIFSIKRILERTWKLNQERYLAFLDLEKAFDWVLREQMWITVHNAEYSVPGKLLRAIRSLYKTYRSAVQPHDNKMSSFGVTSGV